MKGTIVTTSEKQGVLRTGSAALSFAPDAGAENRVLNLYPEVQYQAFEGLGGAVTDAAGYVYSKLTPAQRAEMVQRYFGGDGLRYRFVRVPIDSCDFSLGHYEAMGEATDAALASFSMERNGQYIFPLLEDIQAALGHPLPVMVSPWSPPAFMKSNKERNHGGTLLPEYYDLWARYICRFIQELRGRGYDVRALSVQNEPKAVQTWDSCVYTAAQERDFLARALYPALVAEGLDGLDIYVWDHNKERLYDRALALIDEETGSMIAGLALHWYSGDHFEALRLVRERFPDKKLLLSEACIEYNKYDPSDTLGSAFHYAHDLIGNLANGLNAFCDWNLLLDHQGGPNHVENYCEAPMMYDEQRGALRQNPSVQFLWHFGQFLAPGARRVAHTSYTPRIEAVAFRNPDGRLCLVASNPTTGDEEALLRLEGQVADILLPGRSLSTVVIEPEV